MLTDQMTSADRDACGSVEKRKRLLPAGFFRDGVVLQRKKPAAVWGTGVPRSRIEGTLGHVRAVTFAGDDGHFLLKFPPLEAAEGLVLSLSDGTEEVRISDVAVGEVFLISGQSNMEYDLVNVPDEEIPAPEHPVRCFRIKPAAFPAQAEDVAGAWADSSAKKGFSAVGFFFAEHISRKLDVPVGLINASRGGVGAETFISPYQLACDPFYGKLLEAYELKRFMPENNPESSGDELANSKRLTSAIRACDPELPPLPEALLNWEQAGYDDSFWQTQELPDSWSLAGHTHTGVFLYRKKVLLPESFVGRELLLSPGICDRADICYVNGKQVGATGAANSLLHWNTVRRYTIPAELASRELVIAVQVAAFCSICTYGGLVGPEEEMFIACGNEKISLAGLWRLAEAADTGSAVMENMTMTGSGESKSFHALYDNALFPARHYTLSGVLWYQGEANTLNFSEHYDGLQRGVIRTFRELFSDPRLPVIGFLLPGFQRPHLYSPDSKWAVIREAQLRVTLEETGYPPVNICDCGDVNNVHPPEKRIPGTRAAEFYLALTAGKQPPCGAVCTGVRQTAEDVTLLFETFGFALTGNTGSGSGIAGVTAAGKVIPLTISEIKENSLRLQLPEEELSFITYAWCDNPGNGRLSSSCGFPVFPFKLSLEK